MPFPSEYNKKYWSLVLISVLLSMAIGVAGYFFYEHQKKDFKEEKRHQISAIGNLKVRQIVNWRKERMEDAAIILGSPFLAHHVEQFFKNPDADAVKQELYEWLASLQRHFHYQRVFLVDTKGSIRLSGPEGIEVLDSNTKTLALESVKSQKVIFSDLYRSEPSCLLRLSLLVPISIEKGTKVHPLGTLLLRIDPYQFLYPLIQSWPTPSLTSACLLVRREGDEVLVLNELASGKVAAFSLRFPISEQQMPAVMAVRGREGIFEGLDYRGIPVLAALRAIPDSSWFLVAKVDQEEIYRPLGSRARFIGALVCILVGVTALSVILLWRAQRAEFYKREYEAEMKHQMLAQRFDYLTRYANDSILLMDEGLKIIEANDRAVESYGYSHREMLQLNLKDLRTPEGQSLLDVQLKELEKRGGIILETIHQRKDGTRFPVESSLRVIEIDGKRFYQNIVRDITERKKMENERKKLFEQVQSLSRRLVEIQEEERHNLVRELHDRLGQCLTTMNINLNIIRNELSALATPKIETRLEASLRLLDEMTYHTRDIMSDLRPPMLDDFGLEAALRWYVEQFSIRTGIATEVKLEELIPRLPLMTETALFRIVQESLTNVAKHSQARNVTITQKIESGKVWIIIADDGIGFDPETRLRPEKGPGWGLLSMRERALAIGGEFQIESTQGKGTKIIVEVS